MSDPRISQLHEAPIFDPGVIFPNLLAPAIYFDGITASGHVGGVLQVSLEAHRLNQGPNNTLVLERTQAGTLRFTVDGLRVLHHRLGEMLLAAQQPAGGAEPN